MSRTYGLMPSFDYLTLERTLELVNKNFPEGVINTLELGVHKGGTSRGIFSFFKDHNRVNFHTGIDNQKDFEMESPFPECNFIIGNTMEVYNQIADESQHFLFIDANHSYPMTIIDFILYSGKVKRGGYIAMHDTGRQIHPMKDYQGIGSVNDPDMYISCRKAAKRLGLFNGNREGQDYELIFDEYDRSYDTGGILVIKKMR